MTNQQADFSKFTGLYQVNQTLCFELRPTDKTKENLKKFGDLLVHDENRAAIYPKVKKLLDKKYQKILDESLSNIPAEIAKIAKPSGNEFITEDNDINWELLQKKIEEFRQAQKEAKDKTDENSPQSAVRKLISEILQANEGYKTIVKPSTPAKAFPKKGKYDVEIEKFQNFWCYFLGYNENRKNIFNEKKGSAAYRAIDENFEKFCIAVKRFEYINDTYKDFFSKAEQELRPLLEQHKIQKLEDVFKYSSYSQFLSQSGIDFYNQILGGWFSQGVKEKQKGLNEFINLSRQANQEYKKDKKFAGFPPLDKQILAERESLSVIPHAFNNDNELRKAVRDFINDELGKYEDVYCDDGMKTVDVVAELINFLQAIRRDDDDIFVENDDKVLGKISNSIAGYYNTIADAKEKYVDNNKELFKTKKARNEWLKKPFYSLKELTSLGIKIATDNGDEESVAITDFWNNDNAKKVYGNLTSDIKERVLNILEEHDYAIKEHANDVEVLKNYLDSLQDLLHLARPLYLPDNTEGDQRKLTRFNALYQKLALIIPLYNSVRNYITKKIGEVPKIKLLFDNGTCGDGWMDETANSCVILRKDKIYYLGIVHPDHRNIFTQYSSDGNCYQKMNLVQMSDPAKDLPNLMEIDGKTVRKTKNLDELKNRYLPANINKIRINNSYKRDNDNFSEQDLAAYIAFYMKRIRAYRPNYDFSGLKPANAYFSWKEFCDDLKSQVYKLSFSNISHGYVDDLENKGYLFLFQIYNKDFAAGAHGAPNKATLYWNALFDEDNRKDVVFKLSGYAEIFKRGAGITKPIVHKQGYLLVNRIDKDGNRIPENKYQEILQYAKGKKAEDIDEIARKYPLAVMKEAKFDIVKDRRFTEEKYLFHVPIVINFKSAKSCKINDEVLDYIRNNPDVNIIGIDRGESNLLYVCVINQKGEIIREPISLNVLSHTYKGKDGKEVEVKVDYHEKLDLKEKERDEARKNWSEIGRIKDLKAGYLSLVVHKLAQMMIDNNAIIVLEDLNDRFMQKRGAVEKSVYQKFEKALIDKLNYLIFKNYAKDVDGGLLNGYQFTKPVSGFSDMRGQNGMLFYVPPCYTSAIDPTTGFADLFKFGQYTTAAERFNFLRSFDSITYDAEKDRFRFDFKYSNFKSMIASETLWSVYSATKRLIYKKQDKKVEEHNPTDAIKSVLADNGEQLKNGYDLKNFIEKEKDNNDAVFRIFMALKETMHMRNQNRETKEDYIDSPVEKNGRFFHTGNDSQLPDADANGAYHIALKGLYLIKKCINEKKKLEISKEAWFDFMRDGDFSHLNH